MKKTITIIFLFFAFVLFSGFSLSFGNNIDRSEPLKYKVSRRVNTVYLNLKKGNVYHTSDFCLVEEELLGLSRKSFIEITEYEAVLRGFVKCPDCYNYKSKLYDIQHTVDNIESTVDDIYKILDN